MQEVKSQIDKEEYDKYKAMARKEFNDEMEASISDVWRWGYGWYGARLSEKDGEYFIIHKIGSHCD